MGTMVFSLTVSLLKALICLPLKFDCLIKFGLSNKNDIITVCSRNWCRVMLTDKRILTNYCANKDKTKRGQPMSTTPNTTSTCNARDSGWLAKNIRLV